MALYSAVLILSKHVVIYACGSNKVQASEFYAAPNCEDHVPCIKYQCTI